MKTLDLDEMQRITDAATEGPWGEVKDASGWGVYIYSQPDDTFNRTRVCWLDNRADKRELYNLPFIAHAREWVPALIAEVRRLREVLGMVEWCGDYPMDPCLWCWSVRERGHAPNCPRQAALGIADDAPGT